MRIEYLDGRMLTIREIVELHPELTPNLIRMRILKYGSDNIEKLLEPRRVMRSKNDIKIEKKFLQGLGPRKSISDLGEPSEYEKDLWGY